MRRFLLIALAIVVLAAAGGAAYVVWGRPGTPRHGATSGTPPAARLPFRPPVLAAHHRPTTAPAAREITAALHGPVRAHGLGKQLVGTVVDLDTGASLWQDDPDAVVRPASNAKLLTAAAALSVLGPTATLTTQTERAGRTLWLVGGGDVTLASKPVRSSPTGAAEYPVPATLPQLARATARELRAAGVHRVRLRYDAGAETGPRLAPGWKPAYVSEGDVEAPSALEVDEGRLAPAADGRVSDPAATAAADFARDLAATGIRVRGAPAPGTAPASAAAVAEVRSPTVAALVQQMLTASDNDLAETLARAVARHDGEPGSFAAGAAAVESAVRGLGLPTAGVRLVDGSGLSRRDRVPPATLLAVLRLAAAPGHADLAPILEGLPVAGFSGTLDDRYGGAAAAGAGAVRAKTGTLSGVSALSGLVTDRSGDLLAFSLIAPRTRSADLAEPALDRIAATLARCGCRSPA